MVVCEICKPWGTINTKSNRSKSFERKCFRDFLVLEFILMRVLKSGKMIGGQILCSFFVSDDNIEFLKQKDPPHQSWLSILFSEQILYSRMSSREEEEAKCWRDKFTTKITKSNYQTEMVKGEKDVKSYTDKFTASIIHDDVDDSRNKIESGSHKEHPKLSMMQTKTMRRKELQTVENKVMDEMGSLETRTEKMQTPIPITPRSPRINLSSDKNIAQELTNIVSLSTATTSNDPHKTRCISSKYSHLLGALRMMCRLQGYKIKDMERKCVTIDKFWKVHGKVDQVLCEIVPQLAERATNGLIERKFKPICCRHHH
ncbi:hypothetical protein Tco_0772278 [Tanacetum coccineum]|uniref:Uncharacterized protein n=1 Tax=Tanacetum coccineum TaxID=301880 RepID=A0ABQ4ZII8_9ASTR